MKKKIVYLDMDGVLADFFAHIAPEHNFYNPPEMFKKGFFRNLPIVPGAKEGVAALLANPNLNVYIATKHTSKNFDCATEKVEWINEHFPALIKKMFMVCDKEHLNGDFLIDDDKKWDGFPGEFIHFDEHNPEKAWAKVIEQFKVVE